VSERRVFTARRVTRGDAGGTLYAPVDQHGIESGITPSHDAGVIAREVARLNAGAAAPSAPSHNGQSVKEPEWLTDMRQQFASGNAASFGRMVLTDRVRRLIELVDANAKEREEFLSIARSLLPKLRPNLPIIAKDEIRRLAALVGDST
jgi:hypothetical protein